MTQRRVIQYGVPRSGSTCVWQVLRAMLPDADISKSHDYHENLERLPVVATFRDPRDVLVSRWRVMRKDRLAPLRMSSAELEHHFRLVRHAFGRLARDRAGAPPHAGG